MEIDEAIGGLRNIHAEFSTPEEAKKGREKDRVALLLGIEALKAIKRWRQGPGLDLSSKLPGETQK